MVECKYLIIIRSRRRAFVGVQAFNDRDGEGSQTILSGGYGAFHTLRPEYSGGKRAFRVQGLGFRIQDSRFRVQDSGSRVQGAGFGVQGSGFRVQGSGCRVEHRRSPSGRLRHFEAV